MAIQPNRPVPQPAKPVATASEKKTINVTLRGSGAATLHFTAHARKDGAFTVYAVMRDGTKDAAGKKSAVRGATSVHATYEAARKAVDTLVAESVKLGWGASRGASPKAVDSFDASHIPAPPRQ